MKKPFYFFLLLFALLIAGCHPDSYDTQGNAISISDYKGKWIVMNYFAPWCKPCLTELPELNSLYVLNKNKIVVLGVSYDDLSNQEIEKFANKLGVTFPVLPSFPIEKYGVSQISTLPVTFLFSPQGKIVAVLNGPHTRASIEAKIKKLTEKLLQKPSN